jgi:hypothetical protein
MGCRANLVFAHALLRRTGGEHKLRPYDMQGRVKAAQLADAVKIFTFADAGI